MILVVDNSATMKRVDAKGLARAAVGGFVKKLKGDVRAAIVLFDDSATVSVPLTAVTDESRLEFLEALQKLNYRGKYPDIAIALKQAIRELEVHGRGGAEKSIILLIGGLPDPSDTALVQSRLRALGYGVAPIDGIMGLKTRDAIRQFQRQRGIPADGKLNKTLLVRLEKAYEARWQRELAANAARAGIKIIAVVLGEGFARGQALAEKTFGEYFQIPKAEVLARVFERLSNAFSQAVGVPAAALAVRTIQVPERVEVLPARPAEVALPEDRNQVTEWLTDPAIWVGLLTLVVLEIILGIDNLIFIAILADKLPPHQRDRARVIGLSLALLMRLGLLASISWVMSLTAPLFTVFALEISWRDLILVLGGVFLLIKATIEIHDRLETGPPEHADSVAHARFWPVVAQIVVLDAVFSLDSVITAIGMVDEIYVMMAAVVIAMIVMIVAGKPLTKFVNAHPALVILCLGFLLMVGFVLVADGLGYHVPKGYLYTAIGFSVLIETFNQLALRNRRKWAASIPRRQSTADAVLRLLGGIPVPSSAAVGADVSAVIPEAATEPGFAPAEKAMVRDVLALADRPVQTIMTPRPGVAWIDPGDPKETVLAEVRNSAHRQFLVSRGSVDDVVGIARKEDILALCLNDKPFDLIQIVQKPIAVHEGASILDTLAMFKRAPVDMALVVDEYGGLQGIVTQTDLLEAITGDLPDAEHPEPEVKELEDGSFLVDGTMSIYDAQQRFDLGTLPDGDFNTLAGFVVFLFDRIPAVRERVESHGWSFEVSDMDGWRINKVLARRVGADVESSGVDSTLTPHLHDA
ncbi:MAG: transporter associated domain-containing protein [Chromatiales bacterium]